MIQKVLMATINADHPQTGMEQAFRGIFGAQNVETFDYLQKQRDGLPIHTINRMFMELAIAQKPDWIWLQVQETNCLQPESLELISKNLPGVRISHWTGDMRRSVSPYLGAICQATDITFASSRGQLNAFLEAGARKAHYLQIGVDWDEDVLGLPLWEPPFRVPDVVLCGNYYGDVFPGTYERASVIRALEQAGISVGIVGSGWPDGYPVVGRCGVKQQHHVYRKAKVALNINHFNQIENYYSDRQLISMASGTPVVCWDIPGLIREFTPGTHCAVATRPEEFVDRVKALLENPRWAQELGRAGRKRIIQDHTWFSRVLEAFSIVETL